MLKTPRLQVSLFLLIGLVVSTGAFADTIYLKNGGNIDGTIVSETDKVVDLEVEGGTVQFKRSEIAKIEREGGSQEEPAYVPPPAKAAAPKPKPAAPVSAPAPAAPKAAAPKPASAGPNASGFASKNAERMEAVSSIAIWKPEDKELSIGIFSYAINAEESAKLVNGGDFFFDTQKKPYVAMTLRFNDGAATFDASTLRYYNIVFSRFEGSTMTFNYSGDKWDEEISGFSGEIKEGAALTGRFHKKTVFELDKAAYVWDFSFNTPVNFTGGTVQEALAAPAVPAQAAAKPQLPEKNVTFVTEHTFDPSKVTVETKTDWLGILRSLNANSFRDPKALMALGVAGGVALLVILLSLVFFTYAYYSTTLFLIAKKTQMSHKWMAFIPLFQWIMEIRISRVPLWSIPVMIVLSLVLNKYYSYVSAPFAMYVYFGILKRLQKPLWMLAILGVWAVSWVIKPMFPVGYLFFLIGYGMLAFSKSKAAPAAPTVAAAAPAPEAAKAPDPVPAQTADSVPVVTITGKPVSQPEAPAQAPTPQPQAPLTSTPPASPQPPKADAQ